MNKRLFWGLSLLLLFKVAFAINPFVIKNIKVNGLERIELGTVLIYLPVKVGDTLDDSSADEVIKRLYKTGFFHDITLEAQGNTLIINVSENPIIYQLSITGDHEFDHDKLIQSLKDNGLTDGKIFDSAILEQAVLGLKSEYYNRGLYSVKIATNVIPLSRNRVTINIAIEEGPPAKIKSVLFVGNKIFSQSTLDKQMYLNTGNWLSWWYKDNQYSGDKLSGDIEAIRAFYLNQGYINFRINSIQVQLSADRKSVYITVNINEGAQYKVKSVKLAGDSKSAPMSVLAPLLTIEADDIVDQGQINKVADAIKAKLGDYGYAFAQVNPIPDIDEKTKQVAFTFFVDTSKKVYVRQVNISGNDKTRDVVIRRELRQPEDSLYNTSQIKRSKDRLNLLGYFKNVDVTTTPVAGSNDQVDMDVKVEENNTGNINFGVGFAQGQGLLVNGSVTQANLFGSGKSASLSASTSLLGQNYAMSFTDPYFLTNGTSLGYDLYENVYTPNVANISPYSTQTLGLRARTGIPLSEYDRINFSLGFENNQISLIGNNIPLRFVQFTDQFGNSVNAVPFSMGWSRNTTDSTLWPTTGALFNETADMTLPGVGAQYYRFVSQNTWFVPISKSFTYRLNAQAGLINSYGNSGLVPFYQNFYVGGINSIRGYYIASVGPKDTDGSSLGGTREVIMSNEILFPMPGIREQKTVRMSVFYDIGSLWGGNPFGLTPEQSVRASYGLGLTWISPLGPIKLSYAMPMFNQPNDNLEPFQFMLGTSF